MTQVENNIGAAVPEKACGAGSRREKRWQLEEQRLVELFLAERREPRGRERAVAEKKRCTGILGQSSGILTGLLGQ